MEHDGGWLGGLSVEGAIRAVGGLFPEVALIGTDAAGRVCLWTPEAERLLGWTASSRLGQPAPAGVLGDPNAPNPPRSATVVVARAGGGKLRTRRFSHRLPSGGALWALCPGEPEGEGEALGVPEDAVRFHGLISKAPSMFRVFEIVRNVAATDATVLVRGESGTGKELVAAAIHAESPRRDRPFVAVNCAAFAPSLLESELFGHKKGAFTGATADRTGIFAQADGGTLFLDEVGEIPMDLQAKLLRVLQERTFVPLGGSRPVRVDVRVVAATHRALREEVRAGRFREDLLYRLRVVPIFLPALRERPIDVELLARAFIEQRNAAGPRRVSRVAPEAMRALLAHRWPGNVRELQNVVDYAFAVGRGPEIVLDDLPPELREQPAPKLRLRAEDEATAIREALEAHAGDLGAAAAALGMGRTTLWRKRKQLGL